MPSQKSQTAFSWIYQTNIRKSSNKMCFICSYSYLTSNRLLLDAFYCGFWLYINSYQHAKLCQAGERVQLQQLILECGTTGIYLNFTFMWSAYYKLYGDIKLSWCSEAIRSYALLNISENSSLISRIVLWGHIQHKITQEVEQIEAWGLHCCIKEVGGWLNGPVVIRLLWYE